MAHSIAVEILCSTIPILLYTLCSFKFIVFPLWRKKKQIFFFFFFNIFCLLFWMSIEQWRSSLAAYGVYNYLKFLPFDYNALLDLA
jgi:dipeptide/tripeptide permease